MTKSRFITLISRIVSNPVEIMVVLVLGITSSQFANAQDLTLTNASFDVSRELFAALNKSFVDEWDKQHQDHLTIQQSNAGSSTQARAIIEGFNADVVTLNQTSDIEMLAKAGLVDKKWQQRLPDHSSPFYSTMAFLVRKGNPKHIESWQDLAKPGVKLVFANPKTSGNGRYVYLAAWIASQHDNGNHKAATEDFIRHFLANAVSLDSGGRGATNSFVQNGIGDVLISFESEVDSLQQKYGKNDYDVIIPKVDILAEMPVAWVDANIKQNHSGTAAKAYLEYLYSPKAQQIIAEHYYRGRNADVMKQFARQFPKTELLNITDELGSWDSIMSTQFSSNGELDKLQRP